MPRPEYRVAGKYSQGTEDAPVREFAGRELAGRDRIFNHLASGGIALISGEVDALDELLNYISRRESDLGRLSRHELPSQRLMVEVGQHVAAGLKPPLIQRHLMLLCGEAELGEGELVLVPYKALKSLQTALAERWQVDALGTWLQAGEDVLPPRSQETYALFRDAIAHTASSLPHYSSVLDMGCGCGVLAFIVAKELQTLAPSIITADLLPEAVGSVMLNMERLETEGIIHANQVHIAPPGNLFANVNGVFNLIIFNAPWVLAPVRSRADTALNDEKQRVLARFFGELSSRLIASGKLILGYADNSGEKAVERALDMAKDAGMNVGKEHSLRVATHRKRSKWERIYVWELGRSD
jgi:methylase of polypeptide subunit release factors